MNSSTAAGSGDECTHSTDCDHGTHVGGIAAGSTFTGGHEGVARGAGIVAIKVAQDNPSRPGWTAQFSSIDNALARVLTAQDRTEPEHRVGQPQHRHGLVFTRRQPCLQRGRPDHGELFGQLQAAGVAVVVAAGNEASTSAMSFPGCADQRVRDRRHQRRRRPGGLHQLERRPALVGARRHRSTPRSRPATTTASRTARRWRRRTWRAPSPCSVSASTATASRSRNAAAAARLDATGVDVTRQRRHPQADQRPRRRDQHRQQQRLRQRRDPACRQRAVQRLRLQRLLRRRGRASRDRSASTTASGGTGRRPTTGTATISTEDNGVERHHVRHDPVGLHRQHAGLADASSRSTTTAAPGIRSLVTFPVNGGHDVPDQGRRLRRRQRPAQPAHRERPAADVPRRRGDHRRHRSATTSSTARPATTSSSPVTATTPSTALAGNDRICGDAGDDTINGGAGDDFVLGGSGADTINGDVGNDTLVGNAGGGSNDDDGDTIDGGPGNDFLDGWVGDDTLIGGPGNDQLRRRGRHRPGQLRRLAGRASSPAWRPTRRPATATTPSSRSRT